MPDRETPDTSRSEFSPDVYPRLVGSDVTTSTNGGGIVNCRLNAKGGAHETFLPRKGVNRP